MAEDSRLKEGEPGCGSSGAERRTKGAVKPDDQVRVSVVMPCHNAAATIDEALLSVEQQRIPVKVYAVNDASTDDTGEILEKWRQRWLRKEGAPELAVLTNGHCLGAAGSRNRAVAAADTPYIAYLDADDGWAEGKLDRQIRQLDETGAVLSCTGRELLTPEGARTGRIIGVKERVTYRDLLRHNSINCSSVMIRREAARAFPMEHEDSHEDYITWLKVLRRFGPAAGINEPLLRYRLSNAGKSGSKLKSAGMTFRAYRYMGFGPVRSAACFASYAVHGVWKYLRA